MFNVQHILSVAEGLSGGPFAEGGIMICMESICRSKPSPNHHPKSLQSHPQHSLLNLVVKDWSFPNLGSGLDAVDLRCSAWDRHYGDDVSMFLLLKTWTVQPTWPIDTQKWVTITIMKNLTCSFHRVWMDLRSHINSILGYSKRLHSLTLISAQIPPCFFHIFFHCIKPIIHHPLQPRHAHAHAPPTVCLPVATRLRRGKGRSAEALRGRLANHKEQAMNVREFIKSKCVEQTTDVKTRNPYVVSSTHKGENNITMTNLWWIHEVLDGSDDRFNFYPAPQRWLGVRVARTWNKIGQKCKMDQPLNSCRYYWSSTRFEIAISISLQLN